MLPEAAMSARPLKLLSSMAAREVLAELVRGFTARTGQQVNAESAGGVEVAKRVAAAEAVDVVVLSDTAIDKLIAGAQLRAGRVDLVKSGVAVAVRSAAPKPDISTEEAVKAAVSAAASLSYSTGPSGVYLEKLFARWGILETVKSRIVVPPPGMPVASLVASGKAALGFQQLSELLNVDGIEVLGPLPAAIQTITTFSGAISARCEQPEAAAALLDYMNLPAATAVKQRYGMEPV
jgi:molybdate transport system substrate-binding protein